MYTDVRFTRGLAFVSTTCCGAYNGSSIVAHLGRSFRTDEENCHGLRLITKPLACDTIGQPVTSLIDNINSLHLSARHAGSLAPLVGELPDWDIALYFYRVDK